MPYMVMKAQHGEFLGDMENIGSFQWLKDAQECMMADVWLTARREDADGDEVHNGVDANGMDYAWCDRCSAEWRIFELKSYLFTPAEHKTCPVCGTELMDDMQVCYGCLHEFGEE